MDIYHRQSFNIYCKPTFTHMAPLYEEEVTHYQFSLTAEVQVKPDNGFLLKVLKVVITLYRFQQLITFRAQVDGGCFFLHLTYDWNTPES